MSSSCVWPPSFGDSVFEMSELKALCNEGPEPSSASHVKAERARQVPGDDSPKTPPASTSAPKRCDRDSPPVEDKPLQRRARATPAVKSEVCQSAGLAEAAESDGEDMQLTQLARLEQQMVVEESEDRQRGQELAAKAGLTYNVRFQSGHAKAKLPCPPGVPYSASEDSVEPADQLRVPARGRPRGDTQYATLATWVEENRAGIYQPLRGGNRWYCTRCQREVNCHRPSLSGKRYILDHERCYPAAHTMTAGQAPSACIGVAVGQNIVSALDEIAEAVLQWVGNSCVQTKKEVDPSASCVWSWRQNTLFLRHQQCVGLGSEEEIKQSAEQLLDRDFCKVASVQAEVEDLLLSREQSSQLHVIRMKFQSLPVKIRTEHDSQGGPATGQQDRIRPVIRQQSHPVPLNLFDSFFASQSKIDRGLVRTRRTADEETASELLFMLGNGAGVGDLLSSFGVLMPPQTTLHLQSELVPKPFLAFRRKAQLQENVRLVASLLRSRGTRSAFVGFDESYWRPTWEQVSGLIPTEDGQVAILGGGYHDDEDKDFSLLTAKHLRGLPSAPLSRMSVHLVMTRADDHRQTWDVCTVPLLPASQQGDFSKADFFVQLLGEVMEAYAATNNNLPCLGYALDGGSSNYLARKLGLGLETLDQFEDMAFWKDCVHKPVGLGPYFPFSVLQHSPSSEIILASLDNLHLLKRLGAHHCSGVRCVQYGHSHCHLTLNLPPKAYTMDDAMSDRQEAERTNPALMKDSWISFGHHAYALVSSLLAQCGEAGEMLSSRERLMSAATCYFFLLMNDMLTKQEHGEHAEKYRLPTSTLRNTLHGLYLSIVCNLFPGSPGRDSLSLRSFQEKACEHHFSRAKSPFRGTPSLAQGVWGGHKAHLQQVRAKWKASDPKCDPVPLSEAKTIIEDGLQDAAWTLAFISVGRTPKSIVDDFRAWWPSTGRSLVTQRRGQAAGDAEEDDDDFAMQVEEDAELPPDEDVALLGALEDHVLEDHVLNKQEITQLLEAPPSPKLAEEQPSLETAEQTEQPLVEANLATASSSARVTRTKTWHDLLQHLKTVASFDMTTDQAMLVGACLTRQLLLMPRIRALAAATHQHRGILSRAALAGNDGSEAFCSDYHKMVHELALARSASMSDGKRMSHVEQPQVILYRLPGRQLCLGVVSTIFRGALMTTPGKSNNRRLRTTKPSTQPLTMASCSVVRVWRATEAGNTGRQFAVHACSTVDIVDPIGSILGQIRPASVLCTGALDQAVLALRFHQDQVESINRVVASEEAYQEAEAVEPQSVPEPEPHPVLGHRSFGHNAAGTANLLKYMERLPKLYSDHGLQILDDKNNFIGVGGSVLAPWTELVQQTPDYFEVTCSSIKKDDYGKQVVRKMLDAHPTKGLIGCGISQGDPDFRAPEEEDETRNSLLVIDNRDDRVAPAGSGRV
ncbi:hypothetical protein AK812_SmicGene14669 [Symbiodinium microadriaticum]|uniref:Uncharacterized protein n=1 Tax=Symbiodinium microadriaticum TaxID=2951 RepID=A0A1Q9E4Z3_SYMMI|nr:hypothetical protein AK812_SmicGene14669 [Symbiodinium microadriaticum]